MADPDAPGNGAGLNLELICLRCKARFTNPAYVSASLPVRLRGNHRIVSRLSTVGGVSGAALILEMPT